MADPSGTSSPPLNPGTHPGFFFARKNGPLNLAQDGLEDFGEGKDPREPHGLATGCRTPGPEDFTGKPGNGEQRGGQTSNQYLMLNTSSSATYSSASLSHGPTFRDFGKASTQR